MILQYEFSENVTEISQKMLIFAPSMLKPTRYITRTLSIRISLMVVFAIAMLLLTALFIMSRYSRSAVREEAMRKAEQTLDATVQKVDNILLSAEQAAGNIYIDMLGHLGEPERMSVYTKKLVETNPYVKGCAIAFEPYYYKDRGQYFMSYSHHTGTGGLRAAATPIVEDHTFGQKPYTEQIWYTTPIEERKPSWINPLKELDTEEEPIVTFSLPIYSAEGRPVGVLAVDLSLALITEIVQAAKPSPNSYATLIDDGGSYIVHPDTGKLYHTTVQEYIRQGVHFSVQEAVEAMLAGRTGYRQILMNGVHSYVFYKPFVRSAVPGRAEDELGWSAGIVYPEDDIFDDYRDLLHVVLAIAIVGLLLLLVLCQAFTHRQLLPLRMLTRSAQRIADGHYDEPIPESSQHDEVGRLQNHFVQMQRALATHVGELNRLTATLKEQGEGLAKAKAQAMEADRMKNAFLHNMTNQMSAPVGAIAADVAQLCEHGQEMATGEADRLVDDIQQQGKAVTELLNDLLNVSQEK